MEHRRLRARDRRPENRQSQQSDIDAIQAGYKDIEAGRVMSVEESKSRTEALLSRLKK